MRNWCARHPIYFMGLYALFYLTFFALLERTIQTPDLLVHCRLDDLIPFCKYAIIPYSLWFPWIPFTLFFILYKGERSDFWRLCLPLFAGMTMALLFYAIVPNGLALRPRYVPGNDIFAKAVQSLYRTDTPMNVCPSIHVFNSVTLMLAYYRTRCFDAPRLRWMRPAAAVAAEPSYQLGSQGTQAGLSPVGQVCFFGTEQKGTTMPAKFELIAPCFFGCESTAKFELTRIGAENIRVEDGRLSFCGGAEMIAAANLNLRTVERVMLLLARYKATTFDELFDGVYSIPWEEFLPADAAFPVTGSSLNSQLTSIPACQSVIKKAVVKRLMKGHRTTVLPESGVEYKVRFMLRKNVCEIMLDTTGEGLHKRGYRRNAMEAPLRETLAATIADLGRVRRDSLVEDPFCGSGTLLIEAAQKAMNIAPGLKRRFAAERYSFVPAALWAEQRQKALAESKLDVGFEAFGYDIDPAAVAQANVNAKLAGVENRCHFEVADVATFAAKPEAIVLTNPPYGERLGTIEGAAKLARTLGQQMEASPCAGLYAITADMDFELHYGKRANKRRKMYNGMIPCQLYMYYNAPKTEKMAKPMPKSGFDGKRTHFEKK